MKNLRTFCSLSLTLFGVSLAGQDRPRHAYRVVVYDFSQTSDVEPALGSKTANLLRVALSRDPRLLIVEREQIAKVLKERSDAEQSPALFSPETAAKIGRALEANYVILGQLSTDKKVVNASARLVEIETTAYRAAAVETIDASVPITAAADRLARKLIDQLFPSEKRSGILNLVVEPVGSRVRVMGDDTFYPAPLRMSLSTGLHTLSILPPNETYDPAIEQVRIEAEQETQHKIALVRRSAILRFGSHRPNAVLYIDGGLMGTIAHTSEFRIDAGDHDLMLVASSGVIVKRHEYLRPDTTTDAEALFGRTAITASADGHLLKRVALNDRVTGLAANGGTVYVIADRGKIQAFDALRLTPKWRFSDYESAETPVVVGDRLFLPVRYIEAFQSAVTYPARVLELNPETGAIVRRSKAFDSKWVQVARSTDKALFIFEGSRVLLVSDDDHGFQEIALQAPKPELAVLDWPKCRIVDDFILVGTQSGTSVYVFDLGTGNLIVFIYRCYIHYARQGGGWGNRYESLSCTEKALRRRRAVPHCRLMHGRW